MAYADAGGRGVEGGPLSLRTSYFKLSFKPIIIFFKKQQQKTSFHILRTIIPFP